MRGRRYRRSGPGADDEDVIRLCGACAVGLISPLPGRLRDPPWGHYGPCARSSLDRVGAMPVREARTGAEEMPQQSAERRAGPRHGPVISGDPEIGPLARRATGCGASAPAPVGALLPSFFREEQKRTRGTRPLLNGPAEL